MNNQPTKRLLKTREAADYLGMSASKLRALVHGGVIPIVTNTEHGAFSFDIDDLNAYIQTNKTTQP